MLRQADILGELFVRWRISTRKEPWLSWLTSTAKRNKKHKYVLGPMLPMKVHEFFVVNLIFTLKKAAIKKFVSELRS